MLNKKINDNRDIGATFSTPYEKGVVSQSIRIRYIYCQCYEIVLPNGKTIVTDPFVTHGVNDFSVDDFTGADYIILSHTHIDHDEDVRRLVDIFNGQVICLSPVAMEIAKSFDIPYANICPVDWNGTYYLDGFKLETFHGLHDNRMAREGKEERPSERGDRTLNGIGLENHKSLDELGSLFMLNYVITTDNNFKISYSSGQNFDDYAHYMDIVQPNIMLRHRIRTYSADEFAGQCERVGTQFILPLHHNNALKIGQDLNAYFIAVNEVLKAHGSTARAFNPKPYQWYTFGISIQES
ncbi:MBL fold metallo-hydrolase (plasmid) [Clostridium estertheticum]|uniref:MBL fold metallo-hydrolase n=1 Tax=Clostridium estertheticum TaxID=238834 RepID=UPI001C7D88B8|nr:MBL fold metallo-hydrolase [Clostridium estertheticum]MBX4262193.1 MBL fold metallo-hydrolase [Clostridium estertheticum]WLC73166.1 MBL fold metallo-hydrolase [Clostridium estertheticum]